MSAKQELRAIARNAVMGVPFITEAVYVNLTHFGSVTAFYEKVKNVKADVAAVLV